MIDGATTTDNTLQGNSIGLAPSGTSAIPNGAEGVLISDGANFNDVGTTNAASRNYISGNTSGPGVHITGANTEENTVAYNYIGTDTTGAVAIANAGGVLIDGGASTNFVSKNVISGNEGDGVRIEDAGTHDNQIGGGGGANYIGTDATGTATVPNTLCGAIVAGGARNEVSNITSGNGTANICVLGPATNTFVTGNRVGTTADGTATLTNPGPGILVSNETSGTTSINANLIGGNTVGIEISNSRGGTGFPIDLNSIGTAPLTLTNTSVPNTGDGIRIEGASQGWTITQNDIAFNGGLGIDLGGDGVTPNDKSDVDTGPNDLQNTPELTAAGDFGHNLMVAGTVATTALTPLTVEFFDSASCDPSGHGEGATFLGSVTVTTFGIANVPFTATLNRVPVGSVITATATRNTAPLNTSEFSACVTVLGDSDGDGCLDVKEPGSDHLLGGQRDPNDFWDFFDTTGDHSIDLSDTVDVLSYFGMTDADPQANLRDRDVPNMSQPWKTEEANDGVDLTDAVASLASFGDACSFP